VTSEFYSIKGFKANGLTIPKKSKNWIFLSQVEVKKFVFVSDA
jgi:hypothetical protein